MSGKKAWALIEEADALREQGLRQEATWMSLKGPVMQRVKEAVQLAPKDHNVLFMATWLLQPFTKVDGNAKRLVTDYQSRLDALGGPTDDVLAMVGGKASYEKHRSAVKEAGSGCVVAVVFVLALAIASTAVLLQI